MVNIHYYIVVIQTSYVMHGFRYIHTTTQYVISPSGSTDPSSSASVFLPRHPPHRDEQVAYHATVGGPERKKCVWLGSSM